MAANGDYYKILGVSRTAMESEIKKTYRKLALQYHPDRNPGDKKSEEHFKKINEAYAVLSDKEKRAQYDRFGSAGFHQRYTQEDIFAALMSGIYSRIWDTDRKTYSAGFLATAGGGRDLDRALAAGPGAEVLTWKIYSGEADLASSRPMLRREET